MDTETKHWVIYYVTIVNNEFKGLSLYPQHYKRRYCAKILVGSAR